MRRAKDREGALRRRASEGAREKAGLLSSPGPRDHVEVGTLMVPKPLGRKDNLRNPDQHTHTGGTPLDAPCLLFGFQLLGGFCYLSRGYR